ADVSIGISSNDTTEGTVSLSSVTFTSGNWNSTQTITATGVDDSLDDGDIVYSIVTAAATSSDLGYNTLNASDVSVTNTDNDASGFTISSISGNTSEAGATATFTMVLTAQPTADVSIGISSNDTTEGTVSLSSVTFTSGNWNSTQTITATGVDDSLDDGNIAYSIVTAAATSSDTNYSTLNPNDVSATNIDGDTAGTTISQSSSSTDVSEGGITDTYTLVLTSQPSANVVITVTGNTQVASTPTSLTFTSSNWNTTQTVTATAIRDAVVEGAHTGTITHTAVSSDLAYNSISISSVAVNITDNYKPTANAGSDTTIVEATGTTTLSGTTSTDTDGDTMTYAWAETSDSSDACSLTNPTSTKPTVTVLNKESSYDCIYQLIVNDGYIASTADTITVHVTAVNNAPTIGDLASTVTVSEGASLIILVAAADTDSSSLAFSAQDTAGAFTAHSITVSTLFSSSGNLGTFSWTPDKTLSGDYAIGFQVSDGTNTVTESVVITVTNVNQAPTFSNALPNVSFVAGTTTQTVFDLSEYFSDPDGDTLAYTVTGNQDITANITDNGEVSFTADADFVGTEDMSFVATDPDGLTEQSNEIEVNVAESEGETEIDHITGTSRGKGWITVYGTDNQQLARWKAFPKGGVLPKLAEIKDDLYIFAIKKRSGTTIHIYTTDGETLLKKRLSPRLHPRRLAVGNINTTKATEEMVIATSRGGHIYFKVFSFSPASNKITLLDTNSTYVDNLDFRVDIQKKNVVVIINKKGKLIYSWRPME
ncbi:MAG: Ig-like domain-containing protein, partial [Patescibacteria group bacterium]